jgi:PhnB protein
VLNISRYGDAPGNKLPDEQKGLVMHAMLTIGGGEIMLSDAPPDRPVPAGGNTQIALHFRDEGEITMAFEALAEGGKVSMPLEKTFRAPKIRDAGGRVRRAIDA